MADLGRGVLRLPVHHPGFWESRVLQFLQPAEHAAPRPVHSITVDVAAVVRAGARMARRMDAIRGRAGRVNARGAGRTGVEPTGANSLLLFTQRP